MDEETLLAHREAWGKEKSPAPSTPKLPSSWLGPSWRRAAFRKS
ncbi:hypothetical protein [Arthrobacter globiformis]